MSDSAVRILVSGLIILFALWMTSEISGDFAIYDVTQQCVQSGSFVHSDKVYDCKLRPAPAHASAQSGDSHG